MTWPWRCSVFPHCLWIVRSFFFFNATATTEIYTLSLHDALPILHETRKPPVEMFREFGVPIALATNSNPVRSEEHTSELQSHVNLVCRLLLEKKNKTSSRPAQTVRYLAKGR